MTKITLTKFEGWDLNLCEEAGQDLIEYALVAALMAFTSVAGMNQVAVQISSAFSLIGSTFGSALA